MADTAKQSLEWLSHLPFSIHLNDHDITEIPFESSKNRITEKLKLNNFSMNMIKHVNGFSKNNYTCSYYQEEGLFNLSRKHLPDCLKLYHHNISSFQKNKLTLISFLKSLKIQFDIICLTEIRKSSIGILNNEFKNFHIFIDNPTLAKGGVALLLRKNKINNITELDLNDNFNLKNSCSCKNCHIENKWLSFNIDNLKVIVGGIYRHPNSNLDHFNAALSNTINQINDNTLAFILGDININLLDENSEKVDTYIGNLFENNFIPCITMPTRITNHSATLIDHIFVKPPKKLLQNKCSSGNLFSDISDHLPNFTLFDIKIPKITDRPFTRLFTQNKINNFLENLHIEPSLINDNDLTDANNSYNLFSDNYLTLFNKYFPYVKMSRKSFKNKPHITSGIKVSIKHRNRLFKKYLDNRTELNESIWKKFKNKTTEIIKKAEQNYYKSIISSENNCSKNLWRTFGKILNNNKVKHNKINHLIDRNRKITEPQAVSETINEFFSEVGAKLATNFTNHNNSEYKKYLNPPAPHSFLLYKLNEKEIKDTIKNLKNSNSSGHDHFSTRFIKLSAPILIPALEKIFNLAISTGVYPNNLKVAKVTPIFKKGDPSSVNNYRPISILSTINKIFEKILYTRLTKYINDFQLLYKYQFGFRKNHSTEHALIEITDQIRFSMDNNQITCGIFVDLSKAFDTVNHNILLDKLENLGIRGKALELFKSYLSDRVQYVNIDNCKSKTRPITCGVPQGSVLGPLFFLLFINDLPKCCPSGKVRIFADDTNVFFHCNNIKELIEIGQRIMNQLHTWFTANKLTLNTDKSTFTIFRTKRKIINNLPEYLEFSDFKIKRTSFVKYLGVIIDENLTWDNHINEICTKLKSLFHVFYNIRDYLSIDNIKTIYYTLIYSRIKYGITLYGQAGTKRLKRVQTLQNQLLKVLLGKKYRFPTDNLHRELNILKVKDITNQEILTFVHNYFANKLPAAFDNYYKTFSNFSDRITRNSFTTIKIDDHNTNIAARSLKISGAKIWNDLRSDIKSLPNVKKFKNEFKHKCIPYLLPHNTTS